MVTIGNNRTNKILAVHEELRVPSDVVLKARESKRDRATNEPSHVSVKSACLFTNEDNKNATKLKLTVQSDRTDNVLHVLLRNPKDPQNAAKDSKIAEIHFDKESGQVTDIYGKDSPTHFKRTLAKVCDGSPLLTALTKVECVVGILSGRNPPSDSSIGFMFKEFVSEE